MIKFDYYKDYSLKLSKLTYVNQNHLGLVNTDNTCFINSILQCLFYTIALTDHLMNYEIDYNKNVNDRSTISLYIQLLDELLSSNRVINPYRLVKCIRNNHSEFNTIEGNGNQHDSHEFLLFFLNKLHSQTKTKVNISVTGDIRTSTDKLMNDSLFFFKKTYENDYSFIISKFHGLQYNKFTCLCKPRVLFEPFMDHCLDIKGNLEESFECFYKDKRLDKCGNCKTPIQRNMSLWTIPDFLIINLKRYSYNDYTRQTSYNDSLVEFPFTLDLTPFISKEKNDPNNYIYKLYAINYYIGNNSGTKGHYFSACKSLQGLWYMYDDANVRHVPMCSNLVTKYAYILFYHRERT
jgi:ubiquitin C-terminal hydrolase